MSRSPWSRGVRAAAVAVVVASAWLPTEARAAGLFADADASTVVVRGTVESITPYPKAKLQVFHIRVTRALKGEVAVGETLDLAQEMLFATTQPYFSIGTETLVFGVPLPNYSSFREALPEGRHWRWTERLETASDVAVLTDPALTEAVARYLETREDAEASADFFVHALIGPNTRIRQEILAAIAARREIPPLLDAGRLQPLAAWLRDGGRAPAERANVLVQLARRGVPGVADLARGLADAPGPMQAAAIDALITMKAPPPAERLLALSRSPDPALRLVTSRGLAALGTAPAVDRLAEMLAKEDSLNVRIAIVQAVGPVRDPRVVGLMRVELARPEKDVAMAAAEALVQQGSPEAVDVLTKGLEEGAENTRMASAFALKRLNRREADEVLERNEKTHPDPQVRRLCKLALGESMHEH